MLAIFICQQSSSFDTCAHIANYFLKNFEIMMHNSETTTAGKRGKVFAKRSIIRTVLGKDSKKFGKIRSDEDIHDLILNCVRMMENLTNLLRMNLIKQA